MTTRIWPALGLCALVLAGCGGRDEPAATPAAPAATPAAAVPADVAAAAASVGATPLPLNAAAVDVCAMLARADVEAILGPLAEEPAAETPQGSLLGGCKYVSREMAIVMVSARPAAEYAATVEYARKRGAAEDVTGMPGAAVKTAAGLMIQPPDRPFFVIIFAVNAQGHGDRIARALGGALKL